MPSGCRSVAGRRIAWAWIGRCLQQSADRADVPAHRRLADCTGFGHPDTPTGVADGQPVGVQLLGRRFDETTLLNASAVIEAGAGILTPSTHAEPGFLRTGPSRWLAARLCDLRGRWSRWSCATAATRAVAEPYQRRS